MRWIAALVLLFLVVLSVRGAMRVRSHRPSEMPASPELPTVDPRPSSPPPRAPRPSNGPRPRSGVARLQGTVHGSPGVVDVQAHTATLSVEADDGARRFDARTTAEGRFFLNVPPGHYTLTASWRGEIGSAEVVARADDVREVDVQLGPAAVIRGRLQAPKEAEIEVTARAFRGAAEIDGTVGEDGMFEISGLLPGRKYDLSFSGSRVRKGSLREILAPSEGLEIALDPLAVVRGAVGFPRGERCPIRRVTLRPPGAEGNGEDDDSIVEAAQLLGADCRFELPAPADMPEATLVAVGKGWFLEEQVAIPVRGDPPWVCLNPPCRENPTEGLARLHIALEGVAVDSPVNAEASSRDDDRISFHACSGNGSCTLEDLPVGGTFAVEGHGEDCPAESRQIVLVSGDNFLRLPCRRQRQIEGVIRTAGDVSEALILRCAGGPLRSLIHTRLFEMTCGAEDRTLEFQARRGGPWVSVPLPEVATGPAFVEISP